LTCFWGREVAVGVGESCCACGKPNGEQEFHLASDFL
jgi:hypothetical protein